MSKEVIARLDRIAKRYGSIEAIRDLSLEIRKGELVALLGPNGAGKTTAVRILLGLATPTSGEVQVAGGDPREREVRSAVGVMLQVGRVPETLRVREHIALFSSYYPNGLPMEQVLAAARLERLQNRMFRDLSGGEKQRVLFALAICGDPQLLVLDEPTVGLDVETRRAMWSEIEAFVARGRSVLLTTHYLEEADALANRIVVVNRGAVIAEGTPADIKQTTATKHVSFRSSAEPLRLAQLPGAANLRSSGDRYDVASNDAEVFVRALLNQIDDVRELEVRGGALEDAFVALTTEKEKVA